MEKLDTPRDGPFEGRYVAFLETITHLRTSLHRYCSRMTGSITDGEDVVQEALFQAYRKLDTFDDARPLAPWLFRIAHNRCVDFLRRRGVREEAEEGAAQPDSVVPADPLGPALGRAVEYLVLTLPPMERACVLLKDVFDYSLEDIAELVDSSVGGVKAALNRGRSKLATSPQRTAPPPRAKSADVARLLHLYVERFNQQDWDGLRELIDDRPRRRRASDHPAASTRRRMGAALARARRRDGPTHHWNSRLLAYTVGSPRRGLRRDRLVAFLTAPWPCPYPASIRARNTSRSPLKGETRSI
jgi:RNA polymerase sigma factor (sigma-70 family)